jgi:hypothetical protein
MVTPEAHRWLLSVRSTHPVVRLTATPEISKYFSKVPQKVYAKACDRRSYWSSCISFLLGSQRLHPKEWQSPIHKVVVQTRLPREEHKHGVERLARRAMSINVGSTGDEEDDGGSDEDIT